MVKSYLRYEPLKTFGIISSWLSNIVYDDTGKLAISPALEDVIVWDLKKGIKIGCWHDADNKSEVTVIQKSPNKVDYAVGIWNIKSSMLSVIFNGHRGSVTALVFDKNGTRLASGSKDTDLIVWDIVGEVGLYRMRGHKDQITAIRFLQRPLEGREKSNDESSLSPGFLLSSSKDTLLKLWDLNTQHCIETVVAHRNEIWDFDVSKDESMLVTGSGDPELKVWKLNQQVLASGILESDEDDNDENQKVIVFYGNVARQSKERVTTLKFHPNTNFLGVQGPDRFIEIFRLRTHEEIKKKLHRRRKREEKKLKELNKKNEGGNSETAPPLKSDIRDEIHASDEITLHEIIRTTAKVRSFDFAFMEDTAKTGAIQLLASLKNNMLEVYNCYMPSKKEEKHPHTKLFSVDIHGHRNEIRTLALSSNDELLCSASMDMLKVWNVSTTSCIRSLECGYALCSAFIPGDQYIVIGTKTGELELFDIASSTLLESIDAHDGAIWSLQVQPNRRGLVTGSADKLVKFWNFEIIEKKEPDEITTRNLTLVHTRTLKITDDVLCVRVSPNSKLIAVSLLDATVKVFYQDSLKFFLSLYGHKLPVLSMDISSDNALLVTCSADKNVKIWGLDFGDCHRSIFAHQDSIMSVQFVADTHYFFTAGKDKLVKYWDGDKFENITKLEGHHGEVWALALSKKGEFLVSASHDRSMRIWEQTDEPLFLEEEREKEMEELYESTLTTSMEKTNLEDAVELASAGKQTMETLKSGEKIMEALEIADEDKNAIENYNQMKAKGHAHIAAPPKRNPILLALGNLTAEQYVLRTIEKIRSTELEESLLVLPFTKVISLLGYLDIWAKKEWNIALVCRILFHLLRVHHDQIVANRIMRPMLDSIRMHLRAALKRQKDTLGYNLAAMKHIRRNWEANAIAEFYMDDNNVEGSENIDTNSAKKRKFITLTTD
ncbi:7541_t:CDS:10 [Ambispora leptoticha]|uniref:7541_t:CDS:1 n=1 Tax=Ambispora leptoticha TaxID=144679 RepID=A0A9N8ZZR9_9GLOM|nr:7541_t:CDS:10 [Ambispora leptoticha]